MIQYVLSKVTRQKDLVPEFVSSFKITGVDIDQNPRPRHQSYFEAKMDLMNAIKEIDQRRISKEKFWSIAFEYF